MGLFEFVVYFTHMHEQTINLRDHFGHLSQDEALELWKIWTIDVLKAVMTSDTDMVTLHLYKSDDGRFQVEVGRSDTAEPLKTIQVMAWDAEQV